MSSNLFLAGLVVCLGAIAVHAQDPVKVEPKHYALNFENEKVQVVSVIYGPHEKSSLHEHPGGVVVSITEGHLRFTDENGKTREVFAKPGEARWYPPFKHKVENLGDSTYRAVYIGIRNRAALASLGSPDSLSGEQAGKIISEYLVPQSFIVPGKP
jgi:quercetin dioxygenase-like cupin family protein